MLFSLSPKLPRVDIGSLCSASDLLHKDYLVQRENETSNFLLAWPENYFVRKSLSQKWIALIHSTLKGRCHAIWQLYEKLDGVFASTGLQN